MQEPDAQAIVYQLEKQRDAMASMEEAIAKLETSIAQGHHAIIERRHVADRG
jgi:hypothetical protein